jgi:hypothetical protein
MCFRQSKSNGSAGFGLAAGMDGFSVGLNNVFTNGEAKPGAAGIPASGGVSTVKAFKNAGKRFCRNSNPIITDFY